MTLARILQIRSTAQAHGVSSVTIPPAEVAELCDLAMKYLSSDPPPAGHTLAQIMAMIPPFDDRWTSENKDQWFAGMAKLIAAAS